MKAAVLYGPGDLRIEDRPQPAPGPGQVLVRVAACGVCNSDLNRVARAEVPSLPVVIGHEFAGHVAAVGSGVRTPVGARVAVYPILWCGQCGSCRQRAYESCIRYSYHGSRTDGGFQEYILTRPDNLVLVPDGVSDEEAAMTEPAAVGVHALNRAQLREKDSLVILGAGTIGLITAQVARARGAREIILLDIADEQLAFAQKMGFERALRSDAPDVVEKVRELTGGEGPGVVLEAAGAPASYNLALDLAGALGRVVIMGNVSGDLTIPQKRVSAVLRKQLTVFGTWNSSIVRPENEWEAVHAMVAHKTVDLRPLISHRIGLAQLPDGIRWMGEKREPYRKVMVLF